MATQFKFPINIEEGAPRLELQLSRHGFLFQDEIINKLQVALNGLHAMSHFKLIPVKEFNAKARKICDMVGQHVLICHRHFKVAVPEQYILKEGL